MSVYVILLEKFRRQLRGKQVKILRGPAAVIVESLL